MSSGGNSGDAPANSPDPVLDQVLMQLTSLTRTVNALEGRLAVLQRDLPKDISDLVKRVDSLERSLEPGGARLEAENEGEAELALGSPVAAAQQPDDTVPVPPSSPPAVETGTNTDRTQHLAPADPLLVYESLEDKKNASKRDLVLFLRGATQHYSMTSFSSVREVEEKFYDDFHDWTEDDFTVARSYVGALRDKLLELGVPIRKEARLKISFALASHLAMMKRQLSVPNDKSPRLAPMGTSDHTMMVMSQKEEERSSAFDRIQPKPTDVAKAIPDASRYSGRSDEPFRSKYQVFLRACSITGLKEYDQVMRLTVMEVGFLLGAALDFFQRSVIAFVKTTDDAATMIENHFLPDRVRSMNETAFNTLSLEHVACLVQHPRTNLAILEEFFSKLEMLGRVKLYDATDIQLAARLRDVAIDHVIYSPITHSRDTYAEMKSAMRERATRADLPQTRARVRSAAMGLSQDEEQDAHETADAVLLTDRVYRVPGYGARQRQSAGRSAPTPNNAQRVTEVRNTPPRGRDLTANQAYGSRKWSGPPICFVCGKRNCHSQNHKDQVKKTLSYFTDFVLSQENSEGAADSDEDGSDEAIGCLMVTQLSGMLNGSISFKGIALDTCANFRNTVGDKLFREMQLIWPRLSLSPAEPKITVNGVGGQNQSVGSFEFVFHFGGMKYRMPVHVIPGRTPLVMCHSTMNDFGLSYHSLEGLLVRVSDGYSRKVQMINGLPYLSVSGGFESLLSEAELRKVHRNLGHPSVSTAMRTISAAKLNEPGDRAQLEKITRHCRACQLLSAKPKRFLVSLRDEITGEFNHTVMVDVVFLPDGPALHVVDVGTSFQSAIFLSDMSAHTAWRALRRCWIDVYSGPPHWTVVDKGSNFSAAHFHREAGKLGITVREVPAEAHAEIGIVERQHAVLRKAYKAISMDCPDLCKEDRLSMAIRAVNDMAGPDGISATLLVFGVVPRLGILGDPGTLSYARRGAALREATKIASEFDAKQAIRTALRHRSAPSMTEIESLRRLTPGSDIRVYREQGGWTPCKLIKVNGNCVEYFLPSGRASSATIASVRSLSDETTQLWSAAPNITGVQAGTAASSGYESSREAELRGLVERGTFRVIHLSEIQKGTRIYRTRFVDKTKADGTKKSRLCVQAYKDKDHGLFVAAPTMQRSSMRLFCAICAMMNFDMHLRDISQAFLQSETFLRRKIVARPPPEMNLPRDCLLLIVRPLYGIPESPVHWYQTYHAHHTETLRMKALATDPCFLFKRENAVLVGLVVLQVDDSAVGGKHEFRQLEIEKSKKFPTKPTQVIDEVPQKFNGVELSRLSDGGFSLSQSLHLECPRDITFPQFASLRAKAAYVAYCTRPDLLASSNLLSQVTDATMCQTDVERLRTLCRQASIQQALRFLPLNPNRVEVAVFMDAGFGTNKDFSSQIGVITALRDPVSTRINLINVSSGKAKRVARSALAAETLATSDAFDVGYVLKKNMELMLGRTVKLILYTDARSLYHIMISLAPVPTERRLAIDIAAVREGYEKRDISEIVLIKGDSNPADGCTKFDSNGALQRMLHTNAIVIEPQAWLERDEVVQPPVIPRELIAREPVGSSPEGNVVHE